MAVSRRAFLVGTAVAGAGLVIGLRLGSDTPVPGTVEGSFQPNAWLQVTPDGRFLFQLHKAEMGQGVIGTLPSILAEELDIAPTRLEVELAGIHPAFADPANGGQMTGGSTSITNSYTQLREAGAGARAMLVAAAAARWQVKAAECQTANGTIYHNDKSLTYAEVAETAKDFKGIEYQLKSSNEFRYLGYKQLRPDAVAKSTGTASYGIDVTLPRMKTAVVVRCPHFGGELASWEAGSVTDLPGVLAAFPIHSGIAIIADSYWQARNAAGQLKVSWHKGPLAGLDSEGIRTAQTNALENEEAHIVDSEGDVDAALTDNSISTRYSAPFMHHSPMEPQNSTALAQDGKLTVWSPNQGPDVARGVASHYTGFDKADITIHTTLMGGGFGRRGYPDFVGEVAAIAEQQPDTPIKLVWSREDDMRHDYYRVATLHGIEGSVDENGRIASWNHTVVSSSIIKGMAVSMAASILPDWVPPKIAESMGKFGGNLIAKYDPISTDGANIPYTASNRRIAQVDYDSGIRTGFWRSVGQSYNVFVVEGFVDELAVLAGNDPLDFRLNHLEDAPRHRAVLEAAATKAAWGRLTNEANRGQGIAVSEPFKSYCAMVAEVSATDSGFTVDRIVAAVDCGKVLNPDTVIAQVQGGIIYGLGATLKAPVTFADGAVVESNFHDLPVIRMNETPDIEVVLIDSEEHPTGIGEIAVPAVAPAVANAVYAATGQRLRDLPLQLT